jgi:hypothetical protein
MAAEPETQPNLRWLKIIVIVLGVLILVCAGLLVVGIYKRMSGAGSAPAAAAAGPDMPIPPRPAAAPGAASGGGSAVFGDRQLVLPRGGRLVEVLTAGDRLILRVRLATGTERLVVYDAETGERSGSLEITTIE